MPKIIKKKSTKSVQKKETKVTPSKRMSHKEMLGANKGFFSFLTLLVAVSVYTLTSFMGDSFTNSGALIATDVLSADEVAVVVEKDNPFNDLTAENPNYEAIIDLYYQGIVSGYDDGSFKADKKVNRAEFAKIIAEAVDLDYSTLPPEALSKCFTDVKDLPDHWFAPAVCAAKNMGWVNGYDNGSFGPSKNIVRAEGLKIVLKAFGVEVPENSAVEVSSFADVNLQTDWFVGVAEGAKVNQLISAEGNFDAGVELTRGDLATIIYKARLIET
ncbi:MAG: S-layer homology domain-containing protein [Patescibacteria group bacterium]